MLTVVIAPIDPPRRRSSLAFSQMLTSTPVKSVAEEDSRPPNIGRKRTHATPFMRSAATPGHVSRIQRIFQDATAMMQLDVAYASSPAGSIGSRVSPLSGTSPGRELLPVSPDVTNWRYSSAPQRFAQAKSDVREPFPAKEPPSSGYLPPLPDPSSPASIGSPPDQHASQLSHAQSDTDVYRVASTGLDRSLSELRLNHTSSEPCSYYRLAMLDESPDQISEPTTGLDIFCSPAAKAAADSANCKRGLSSPGYSQTTDDIGSGPRCLDPSVHHTHADKNIGPGPRCPDPAVHQKNPNSKTLAVPRPPYCRRANSRSSPLPPLKATHPTQYQHYHSSPPRNGYETLSGPLQPHLQSHFLPPPLGEHFQPRWSNFPAHSASPGAYSFSTEAAKITVSSAAPDSRIRDSYRTDTLTPWRNRRLNMRRPVSRQ